MDRSSRESTGEVCILSRQDIHTADSSVTDRPF